MFNSLFGKKKEEPVQTEDVEKTEELEFPPPSEELETVVNDMYQQLKKDSIGNLSSIEK